MTSDVVKLVNTPSAPMTEQANAIAANAPDLAISKKTRILDELGTNLLRLVFMW